jgi:hypothetical protein
VTPLELETGHGKSDRRHGTILQLRCEVYRFQLSVQRLDVLPK